MTSTHTTTHSYPVVGMHCQACVAKVKDALLRQPAVLEATVSLNPPLAIITMDRHLSAGVLTLGLRQAGLPYTVAEGEVGTNPAQKHTKAAAAALNGFSVKLNWLTTYKPILVVLGFILAGTLLREIIAQRWQWHPMMTNFMGGFFVTFAFFKLLDVKGFADAYRAYDVLARRMPVYGSLYPFLELALGLLYLTGAYPLATNTATLLLMAISLVGVVQSVLAKRTLPCACLGTGFNLPMSTVTLVEDGTMAAMALSMLFTVL